MPVKVHTHPLLDAVTFQAAWPRPLGETTVDLSAGLRLDHPAPMRSDDALRGAVRDLLRHGGFKPTGRSKPASEYLLKAATEGTLGTINAAVDVCNVVSLHSGLPISVVDMDKTVGELEVRIAPEGTRYVFNASGQEIDLGGLICLHDAEGPIANAVKDCQRTKTSSATQRTFWVVWGTNAAPGRAHQAAAWAQALLREQGAATS